MKLYNRVLVIVILLINFQLSAQDGSPSPYSFFGLGDLSFSGNAENVSMGGLGVYTDSLHYNINNTTSLSRLKYINLTIGMNNRFIQMSDQNKTQNASTHYLNYFALGIPFGNKFGFGLGLLPETTSEYKIKEKNNLGIYSYKGHGGISRLFVAAAYNVNKQLSVGLEYQYHFGFIQHEYLWLHNNSTTYSRENNSIDLKGSTLKFTADYKFNLSKNNYFKSYLTYQFNNYMNAGYIGYLHLIRTLSNGTEVIVSNTEKPEKKDKILFPSILNAGLGYGKTNKWFFGADFSYKPMQNFKNEFYDPNFLVYKNAFNIKIGAMYQPEYNSLTSYLKRVTYRAGGYYNKTGLCIYGKDITDFGITFGIGLPGLKSLSNLNLGVAIGQRGIKTQNLIKENYFNVYLSFSLNDVWFIKRKIN